MKFVSRSQVLVEKPLTIRRHIIHRVELVAHEGRAHQRNAFLRQLRTGGMHAFESWRQPAEGREISRRLANAFFSIFRAWRRWRHHFPREWRTMRRVGGEKNVQERCSAPRQADDE